MRPGLALELLEPRQMLAAGPVISEFVASNSRGLVDDLGERSDWIELYNPTSGPVDLNQWYLSNDAANLTQWQFPAVSLAPGSCMVVFASGKDRADPTKPLHCSFKIGASGEYLALVQPDGATIASEFSPTFPPQYGDMSYGVVQSLTTLLTEGASGKYRVPVSADSGLGTTWTGRTYVDSAWSSATTGVGFDTSGALNSSIRTNVGAMRNVNSSLWLRVPFTVSTLAGLDGLTLQMKYNDGFVAYLNGQEIARSNAPTGAPRWNSAATAVRDSASSATFQNFDAGRYLSSLQIGANVLAIQGLNTTATDGNFLLSPRLLGTTTPLDSPTYRYFATPTPGTANVTASTDIVQDTKFSVDRGFFDSPFQVAITTGTPEATIRYTTDGSQPTATTGTAYTAPINITTTTVLRAAAYKTGYQPSNVDTQTYVFLGSVVKQPANPAGWPTTWISNGATVSANYAVDSKVVNDSRYAGTIKNDLRAIPTLSLVIKPADLFDSSTGIYNHTYTDGLVDPAGKDWERPASAEMIGPDGKSEFQIDCGVQIHGGWSRNPPASGTLYNRKQSFQLDFSADFGPTKLKYDFFGDGLVDSFDHLVLLGRFNDSWSLENGFASLLQDQWTQATQNDMGIALGTGSLASHSQWVQLYINGLYWGMYQVTEKPDSSFASDYHGGNKEDYDTYHTGALADGTSGTWNALWAALNASPMNYATVQSLLDVPAFISYMMVNQFGGNWDWPWNNWWASCKRVGGKWQFHSFDGEGNCYDDGNITRNKLVSPGGPGDIFHKLLASAEFRMAYSDQLYAALFHGGPLSAEANTARLNRLAAVVDRAIVGESARWGDGRTDAVYPPITRDGNWVPKLNWMRNSFFPQRPAQFLAQCRAPGWIDYNNNYVQDANEPSQPAIYPAINPPEYSARGFVAAGSRVTITASAGTIYYTTDGSDPRSPGGAVSPTARIYSAAITPTNGMVLKSRLYSGGTWSALDQAKFYVGAAAAPGKLVITEVNYHPVGPTAAERELNGAWDHNSFEFIELVNTTSTPLNLTDARFANGITFDFAANGVTQVEANQYVVLVADREAFQARYGTAIPIAGQYVGGLNDGGEQITLLDWAGQAIAEFTYNGTSAWPGRADGNGSTLELVSATGSYSDPANWRSSTEYSGSPGRAGVGPVTDVVINEVLAHTDEPLVDAIELYNTTADPIDIGGWYLSDSSADYQKFRIPDDTVLAAHDYIVFYQGHWVDHVLVSDADEFGGGPTGFGLSAAHGDDVYLMKVDSEGNRSFSDHVDFGATANGESMGRWQDDQGGWRFYPMRQGTLGEANDPESAPGGNGPRVGPLVISEVMYSPKRYSSTLPLSPTETSKGFTSLDQMEYIEICNPTASAVDLTHWRLDGGASYDFADNTTLPAHTSMLVVSFDPAANAGAMLTQFKTRYTVGGSVKVVGPYAGHLDDTADKVRLLRPDTPPPEEPAFYPPLLEDEVSYVSSWGAAGDAKSLTRFAADAWGLNRGSWVINATSAGLYGQVGGQYVFYNNSSYDNRNTSTSPLDDNAIASDKRALLPGQQASFANYTSYARGLNGLMIDLNGAGSVGSSDFAFRVGNDSDLAGGAWTAPGSLPSISSRAAVNGVTRVTLTWTDATAPKNQWLEVKVLVTSRTGLSVPYVFYFGNAVGESGNNAVQPEADTVVDQSDEQAVRANNESEPAAVTNPWDFNRDRRVNALDEIIARANARSGADVLKLINLAAGGALAASALSGSTLPSAASDEVAVPASQSVLPSAALPAPAVARDVAAVLVPRPLLPPKAAAGLAPAAALAAAHDAVLATVGPATPQARRLAELALCEWLRESHARPARKQAPVPAPAPLAAMLQ